MAEKRSEEFLTDLKCTVNVSDKVKDQITLTEVTLTESLLTPGLQTTLIVQNKINMPNGIKNLDEFHGAEVYIKATRPILKKFDRKDYLETRQKIYRLSNRELISQNVEEFKLDACDPTLIKDALTFVSKSWSCTDPSSVVSYILTNCLNAQNTDVEASYPKKDYVAENIHPFQVITQQAESALTVSKSDPSFVHFMTYQDRSGKDVPTHNFRSITEMASQSPVFNFVYGGKFQTQQNYALPQDILAYSFPCDFDLLSDALNGLDENGNEVFSLITYNVFSGLVSNFGGPIGDCGVSMFSAATNLGTAADQDSCNTDVEKFLIKRKARMGLIEQDKIALRMTVPFNPNLNAGKVIRAQFINTETGTQNYGSGEYMIVSMTHNLKMGGFGTTVLDCVSDTVAAGKV